MTSTLRALAGRIRRPLSQLGPLDTYRTLLFAGTAVNGLIALPYLVREGPTQALGGISALACLAAIWTRGFRRRDFHTAWLVPETALLAVAGAAIANKAAFEGFVTCALYFRLLYGQRRDAFLIPTTYLAAFTAGRALMDAPVSGTNLLLYAAWFALSAVVGHTIYRTLVRYDQLRRSVELSESRFRALTENSHDAVAIIDADGLTRYASPAALRLVGLPESDVIGRPALDHIHPDDRPTLVSGLTRLAAQDGASATAEARYRRGDGAYGWCEFTAEAMLGVAGVEGIVVNYRDVTAQKEADAALRASEERYRALAELGSDFAYAISVAADGRPFIAWATESMTRITGYSLAEVDADGWGPLVHPDDRPAVERRRAALMLGEPHEAELRIRTKTGGERRVRLVSRPVPPAAPGERARIYCVAQDVTEQRRLEASLLEANEHLRHALAQLADAQAREAEQERLRALGQMASGIAHDFNNALAPVVGFSDLLLNVPGALADEAKVRHYLELIHTGGQDAAQVVARLREFYRARGADEKTERIDLGALLHQVIDLTRPKWKDEAQAAGRTIEVCTEVDEPLAVRGAPAELRELFTNLVMNAVDAMPRGGRLTLRCTGSGDSVLAEVIDTGTGMSENVRRHCLEPFFTTKGVGGTGLGLAMAHGIVRRHGGSLEIDSALERGTTFRIAFPRYRDGGVQPAAGDARAGGSASHAWRVLLVDDEATVRSVGSALLSTHGHQVTTAESGDEALATLREQKGGFDLVITDRAMPGMNGDRLALMIKEWFPGLPVILATGYGTLMLGTGESPPGVDAVLPKPYVWHSLEATMERVLSSHTPEPAAVAATNDGLMLRAPARHSP